MEETTNSLKTNHGPNAFLARASGFLTLLCVVIPAVFWAGACLRTRRLGSLSITPTAGLSWRRFLTPS